MRPGCACDGRPQIGTGAVLGLGPISTLERVVNGRGICQARNVTIEHGWPLLFQYHTSRRCAFAARTDSQAWSSARRAAATSIAASAAPVAPLAVIQSASSAVAVSSGPSLLPASTRPPASLPEATDAADPRNAGLSSPSVPHHRTLPLRPAPGEDTSRYARSHAAALILEGPAERRLFSDTPRHAPRHTATAGRKQHVALTESYSSPRHYRVDPSKQWASATAGAGTQCAGAGEASDSAFQPAPLRVQQQQQQLKNHSNSQLHHANRQQQHVGDLVGFAMSRYNVQSSTLSNRVLAHTHTPLGENGGLRELERIAERGKAAANGVRTPYNCAWDRSDSVADGSSSRSQGMERTGFRIAEPSPPVAMLAEDATAAATFAAAATSAKGLELSHMSKCAPHVGSSVPLSHVMGRCIPIPREATGAVLANRTGPSLVCTTGGIDTSRDRSVSNVGNHNGNARSVPSGDLSGRSALGSCAGTTAASGAPAGADPINEGRICSIGSAGRAIDSDGKPGLGGTRGGSGAAEAAGHTASPDQLSLFTVQTYMRVSDRVCLTRAMHASRAPGVGASSYQTEWRRGGSLSGAVCGHGAKALKSAPAPGVRAPGTVGGSTALREREPRVVSPGATTAFAAHCRVPRQVTEPVPSAGPDAAGRAALAGAGAAATATAMLLGNGGERCSDFENVRRSGSGGNGRGRHGMMRQAVPGASTCAPSLHGAALRKADAATSPHVMHADADLQSLATSLVRDLEASERSHGAEVAGCQSRQRRASWDAGSGGVESRAEEHARRRLTQGLIGPGRPPEAECSSNSTASGHGGAGGQHIPTRGSLGRWRELLSSLRAAKSLAEMEHLVSLYGDGFGSEHVAAALELLPDLATAPCGTAERVAPSARGDGVGATAVHAASAASTVEQRQSQTQRIVRRLLDISVRLLTQQRRISGTCLLALLVRPRQLGLVPEQGWVLPVLKKLITAAPSLEPRQLVVLLETLAAGDMWEYAPASGTVARRLTLRIAQQLEVALPHLPVHLAARALGAVARLAPRGFGPFLEREAQRDAGGFAVQLAIRRAREAATGPAGGPAAGWYEIDGGLGNGHPAVVAWAGRYVDHSFSTSYMSYLRTALLLRAVGGEDAMRFLDAIVRFAEWPGVAGLRNPDQVMGLKSRVTAAAAAVADNVAATTAPSACGAAVLSSRESTGSSTNADGASCAVKPCFRSHAVADIPQLAASAHVESGPPSAGSSASANDASAVGDPSDCPLQPPAATSTSTSTPERDSLVRNDLIRPLRRAVSLPRAALTATAGGDALYASVGSRSSMLTSRRAGLQPHRQVAQPRHRPSLPLLPTSLAPGHSTAEASRDVVIADPHAAILMDLIALVPAPPIPSTAAREAPTAAAATAPQYGKESACDLNLYCNVLWALVRLGVRPSPPWVGALLAATQPHLASLGSGTLARMWWALCIVRWAPAPAWRASFMSAIRGTAATLAPDQVCMLLGGFGMWSCQPRRPWLDELLAQVQVRGTCGVGFPLPLLA
ncbi:hypothetical protein Vretifemale_14873 [Volvox reticuliferus]|uniref:Uncharacterized protein n=1 Tax=Volvox reticuliferus TaxID=1737510 RepID=A0A8J4FUK7_9CHLO|nr:hypothetical protein Vretifemale_14873 [Volvox reticuliferus]